MSMLQLIFNKLEQDSQKMQQIKSSPVQNNMYNALKTNNVNDGMLLADNFCKSCGMSREEMLREAKAFFNIR